MATRNTTPNRRSAQTKQQRAVSPRILGVARQKLIHFGLAVLTIGLISGYLYTRPPGTSYAASCTVSATLVNSCRPWFGIFANKYPQVSTNIRDQLNYHEQRIGRQGDFMHLYNGVGENTLSSTAIQYVNRPNTYLLLNWKPSSSWSAASGGNAGVNATIDQMADSIKAVAPKKIMLALFHEPADDITSGASGCDPSIYKGSAGTPADYRAMWANVRSRFDAKGISNVVWALNLHSFPKWNCTVDDMWPGNNLVDWFLYDNYGTGNETWTQSIGEYYNFLSSNSNATHAYTSKPWGLAEYGTSDMSDAAKAAYYDGARTALINKTFPNLKLYTIFDSNADADHRVGYNSAGNYDDNLQSHFRAFAQDPRFTDAFYTTSTPTPPPAPAPDTTAPTIQVTAPTNGAKVSSTITASGNASDANGVKSVTLRIDNQFIATDTSAPYSFSIDTKKYANGQHTITLRAFDQADNMGEAGVTVTIDNQAPAPVVTNPTGGGTPTTTVSTSTPTSSSKPVAVKGKVVLSTEGSGDITSVVIDGEEVGGSSIDTTKLTDGVHKITVTEDGKKKDIYVAVDNPWHVALTNQIKARPVPYAVSSSLVILGLIAGWLFRTRIYNTILRFQNDKAAKNRRR